MAISSNDREKNHVANAKEPVKLDEGKAELYKYVKDQHDKYVAARDSMINRFGNIRIMAGLVLTVFSFSLSLLGKTFEAAGSSLSWMLVLAPLVPFLLAVYFVVRALVEIPQVVGSIDLKLPGAEQHKITEWMQLPALDADKVIQGLTTNYLLAIEGNRQANEAAYASLSRSTKHIRRALFTTVAFLLMTLISSVWIGVAASNRARETNSGFKPGAPPRGRPYPNPNRPAR